MGRIPPLSAEERAETLAELALLPVPEGVSVSDWELLKGALEAALCGRQASQLPAEQRNAVTDLEVVDQGGTQLLQWTYRNVGDYSLDGEVAVAELTVIGQNLRKTTASPDWDAKARFADGNEDGEVNVSDITPIGQNLGSQAYGYVVYGSTGQDGPWFKLGTAALNSGTGKPPVFSYDVTSAGYAYYTVSPHDSNGGDWLRGGGATVTLGEATELASQPVGTTGGTLTGPAGSLIDGVTLTIPAAAFTGGAQVGLGYREGAANLVSGRQMGPIVEFTTDYPYPFDEPVTIAVPFTGDPDELPVPFYVNENRQLELCDIEDFDRAGGTVSFQTWHASSYVVALARALDPLALEHDTGYDPEVHGFQIDNSGSQYERDGECYGMAAWSAAWFYDIHGLPFYPLYMEPVGSSGLTGQDILATRAHASVMRAWTIYSDTLKTQNEFTPEEEFLLLRYALINSNRPILLFLSDPVIKGANHVVVAFAFVGNNIYLYDPNEPGQTETLEFVGPNWKPYNSSAGFRRVRTVGDGSLARKESFGAILYDAERNFDNSAGTTLDFDAPEHDSAVQVAETDLLIQAVQGELRAEELILINDEGRQRFLIFEGVGNHWQVQGQLKLLAGHNWFQVLTRAADGRGIWHDVPNNYTNTKGYHVIGDFDTPEARFPVRIWMSNYEWPFSDPNLELVVYEPDGDVLPYFANSGNLYPNHGWYDGLGGDHYFQLARNTHEVLYDQEYKIRIRYRGGTIGDPRPSKYYLNIQLNNMTGADLDNPDNWESWEVFEGEVSEPPPFEESNNYFYEGTGWSQWYSFTPHMPGE